MDPYQFTKNLPKYEKAIFWTQKRRRLLFESNLRLYIILYMV